MDDSEKLIGKRTEKGREKEGEEKGRERVRGSEIVRESETFTPHHFSVRLIIQARRLEQLMGRSFSCKADQLTAQHFWPFQKAKRPKRGFLRLDFGLSR